MNKFKVICTIGPASLNDKVLLGLKLRNVDFLRINLSHTPKSDIERIIKFLVRYNIEIIIDTEGPQVRTGLESEIFLEEGADLRIYNREVKCNSKELFLSPITCLDNLIIGDLIRLDFNSAMIRVTDVSKFESEGYISTRVIIGGLVGAHKCVSFDRAPNLPIYSSKDCFAINLAKKYGIKHFTLSFVDNKNDVEKFKELYPDALRYSKIETLEALVNIDEIIAVSNGILIDRGDLSSEVPIEKIPFVQKYVLNKARKASKDAFIATNTLERMSFSLKPDKSEVNDIINTILDGATGIALTKETAIGKHPLETINMLNLLKKQVTYLGLDSDSNRISIDKSIIKNSYIEKYAPPSLLVRPHGGNLINRSFEGTLSEISPKMKRLFVDKRIIMDINHIANGAFSPLEGFLDEENLKSVLDEMRLVNGNVWSIPVILQIDEEMFDEVKNEEQVILSYIGDKEDYAILSVEQIYELNKSETLKKWFGTDDSRHPGVSYIGNKGKYAIGGKIQSLQNSFNISGNIYELNPEQTRLIFSERGWSKVVGFHTRNMVHRAHEYIQLDALHKEGCDGLFIHPVVGDKKKGDFVRELIIESYHYMLNKVYPRGKVVLSPFFSYSRFSGPREAVFTAIIRKNFGCSHFIVGRDHTGVSNYYEPKESHHIFNNFTYEELGITIVNYDEIYFSPSKDEYLAMEPEKLLDSKDKSMISGSKVRKIIEAGQNVPKWLMRPEVFELISNRIERGEEIFLK